MAITCDLKWQEFYLEGLIVLWFMYARTYIHMHARARAHTHTHIRAHTVGNSSVIITLTKKQINYSVITHSFLCKIFLIINTGV